MQGAFPTVGEHVASILQIIMVDLALAGDNAVVIGAVASRAPVGKVRGRIIAAGVAAAIALRIVFAAGVGVLLALPGVNLAGAALLFWVAWKMASEISGHPLSKRPSLGSSQPNKVRDDNYQLLFLQIAAADISMSLDNVLAVSAIAHGDLAALAVGIAFSVALMAVAATMIARFINRRRWIVWVAVAIIIYVAASLAYEGIQVLMSPGA
ncbi:MAG: YjbE family putative metal transport protein [Parvularculaceae bacterium]